MLDGELEYKIVCATQSISKLRTTKRRDEVTCKHCLVNMEKRIALIRDKYSNKLRRIPWVIEWEKDLKEAL